ncbi:putative membrane protein [Escherichia coli 5-172-05_S1_C3]|nr:putative membrane protein [Escherichia coli 5-172-05_S1_C3]
MFIFICSFLFSFVLLESVFVCIFLYFSICGRYQVFTDTLF